MRGIFQGIFKICQTVTSVIWGFPWRIRNWPSVYLTERLVWDWGGALSAALQYCCLWSTLCQLQPGALLVSSGPWRCCAALLVVFIHLLSSVFLQWTHYLVQRLYWAGVTVLVSALIHIFCLSLYMFSAEAFLEFCSLCMDHYRCRDLLSTVTGTELLSDTWSSDQGGSFCGGAWQNAWSTPCTCTPSSLMRPTWKCCLPGLWVNLGLYEFLMFGVNYSIVLSSTHKNSIMAVITGLLFDVSVILSFTFILNHWLKNVRFLPQADSLWPSFSSFTWSIWFCLVFRPCWLRWTKSFLPNFLAASALCTVSQRCGGKLIPTWIQHRIDFAAFL